MAATLREALDVEAELIAGDKGIYDIRLGDTMVFSKHAAGRYPDDDEIIAALREAGVAAPA